MGSYTIVRPLERGGMASIYLARPAVGGSLVALKMVRSAEGHEAEHARMLLDETAILSSIDHPNVVRVVSHGHGEDGFYLALEYVEGCSVAQLLRAVAQRGQRLSPELAVHFALAIADGLHAAHEARGEDGERLGVVHRDVSPQNLLVSRRGHVKLIDFGVARARGRRQSTGLLVKGKLQYMAPEQAMNGSLDRRTDVYALGVVLWEMITGRPLFEADTPYEMYRRIRRPRVAPPSAHSFSVPHALDEVLLRALSTDPARRPASALELREELAAAVPLAEAFDTGDVADVVRALLDCETMTPLASPFVVHGSKERADDTIDDSDLWLAPRASAPYEVRLRDVSADQQGALDERDDETRPFSREVVEEPERGLLGRLLRPLGLAATLGIAFVLLGLRV